MYHTAFQRMSLVTLPYASGHADQELAKTESKAASVPRAIERLSVIVPTFQFVSLGACCVGKQVQKSQQPQVNSALQSSKCNVICAGLLDFGTIGSSTIIPPQPLLAKLSS